MQVIENNILPLPGFLAFNIFGLVLVRKRKWQEKSEWYKMRVCNHEGIHTAQMDDFAQFLKWCPPLQRVVGGIIFYFLYLLEWFWEIVVPPKGAYRWISFEEEAYAHESELDYLASRKPFAQWRNKS